MSKNIISQMICHALNIKFIDFSKAENFIKLLDILFKLHGFFNLQIKRRKKNILEDTLEIIYEEIYENKVEHPLQIKELTCLINNEYWSE